MHKWNRRLTFSLICVLISAATLGCSQLSSLGSGTSAQATPTPTDIAGGIGDTSSKPTFPYTNSNWTLELELLIGPSDCSSDPFETYTFATSDSSNSFS